jgi:hypothetical protein
MTNSIQTRPASEFDMVIGWLIDHDAKKRDVAVSILTRLGPPAVSMLVEEAISADKEAEHRIAILGVIERIGGTLELDDAVRLRSLIWHPDPSVRDKAEKAVRITYRGSQQ